MDKLAFYKEWFYKEAERHHSLNNSLNIPIGILVGLFAIITFLAKEFHFKEETSCFVIPLFISLLIASILFWLAVSFFLFRAYNNLFKGYTYDGLPYATTLLKQYIELEKYVQDNKQDLEEGINANVLFEEQLIDMLAEYIDSNVYNNDRKSRLLHNAKQSLLACMISLMLCSMPFIANQLNTSAQTDKLKKITHSNLQYPSPLPPKDHSYEQSKQSETTTTTTTTTKEINKGR